jgi:ABC-2 type transport system ATP-binding protein
LNVPAIQIEHLGHHYPASRQRRGSGHGYSAARAALDDVSFTVDSGEVFGILGPNGGGKTTLFRILSTMLRPAGRGGGTTGRALVFGHDVLKEPEAVRRQLGVVFQMPSLDIKLTAQENLMHQGRLYGLGGADLRKRIGHWLDRFGLADRRDDYVEQFSGGMRRRVELAKALLHQPRLLLMDEPATGLDPAARRELWDQLQILRSDHDMTIALTTHLMDEADRCNRLAILAAGRLVAVDDPISLKGSIGGDVISLDPNVNVADNQPQQFAELITREFGPWQPDAQPIVVHGRVRCEKPNGAELVAALTSRFSDRFSSITIGQPTLEDVFLHLTGSAFTNGEG